MVVADDEGCLKVRRFGATVRRPVKPDLPAAPALTETEARQVTLVQAIEQDGGADAAQSLWTAEDRAWATRLAREGMAPGAPPQRFVVDRARHAAQRLRGRDPAIGRWLDARLQAGPWLLPALLLGLGVGVVVDQIGPSQTINLLAPPVWVLVIWNLAVYALLAVQALLPVRASRGLRKALQGLGTVRLPSIGPLPRVAARWALLSAPWQGARAALLLHLAAAALAGGVVAGLYVRGLVLDYRAGWQSTFLDPAAVHAVLSTLLAPASAVSGVALPDATAIAALRMAAGGTAQGGAAAWLHLYATTLALFVMGPRLILALAAALQVRRRSWQGALPWSEPYFQSLLAQATQGPQQVWVLPHGAALAPGLALALQARLAAEFDAGASLLVADPLPYGDEDRADRLQPPTQSTLVLLVESMATTPESEVHGRLLQTLRASTSLPLRLVLDETAYQARLGGDTARYDRRKALWQAMADSQGAALLTINSGSGRQP